MAAEGLGLGLALTLTNPNPSIILVEMRLVWVVMCSTEVSSFHPCDLEYVIVVLSDPPGRKGGAGVSRGQQGCRYQPSVFGFQEQQPAQECVCQHLQR